MSAETEFGGASTPVDDDEVASVEIEIPRDGKGRPLIKQADGKLKAYTRASTFTEVLKNTWTLERWKRRQVLRGVTMRPDLIIAATRANNIPDEGARNDALNDLVEECMHQAGANAQADIGTALHGIFENVDHGDDLVGLPVAYMPGVTAYKKITAWLRMVSTESFGVCEETVTVHDAITGEPAQVDLTIAGSWDRIVEFRMPDDDDAPDGQWPFPFTPDSVRGRRYILDNKTNQEKSLSYNWTWWAAQTAIYSRCQKYYPDGTRESLGSVSQTRGLILHQPSGTDVASLYWIDLAGGWKAVGLAAQVRGLGPVRSKLKKLVLSLRPPSRSELIMAEIAAADDYPALLAIHAEHKVAWTDRHTEAAKIRKAEIEGRQ